MCDFIDLLPSALRALAEKCEYPLYVVGGSPRDFLAGYAKSPSDFTDWDICAPVPAEKFERDAAKAGFFVHSVFKNTGTVKLTDPDGAGYEFSAFRSDEYIRGEHTPARVYFTEDMALDARRRDFTCNAVYFEIEKGVFCDPLQGIADIEKKTVRTVRESRRVFGEDGLRLLRFARQCGQLGFTPERESLQGARENAFLIRDIAPERIFKEMELCLTADQKYGVTDGHYRALEILKDTRVLHILFPELALGDGMAQRADFHKYDVLEHSLRCALYAPANIRWAALLHDVGKPYCQIRDGNSHAHPQEGARIARAILERLKAPGRLVERVEELVSRHMYDFNGKTGERKLRRYLVENYRILPELIALKQADFSACMDNVSVCPTKIRWENLLQKMHEEGVPFSLKGLKITGKDLLNAGMPPENVGKTLRELLRICACEPQENTPERLLKRAHI